MTEVTYLEDIALGEEREFGRYEVTEDEIIEFARQYDPQPFHTDPEAAKDSIYGGLIASGWHTCAMYMRMICDDRVDDGGLSAMGSPGFDDLKWLQPVRPGDVLSVRSKVISTTPSQRRPDRGTLRVRTRIVNQHGEVVAEMTNLATFRRRPAS
ncbi:MAG: MaoC family dehydratase [Alphaproteobacteria bacterium]|jgi:acyl dehydratase|nr:MaoC family dehydratase [Alphaproteobacteria bacterium]MDP6813809.1 MaoC family dehydratase [Alphaproteobacteria bacterium]|tara:strand:+ start:113 stop:574 length:462 start_codon:yes stop_codon:yes gene_type:complete